MKDDDLIAPSRSQTYDLPIITSDAVPLSLFNYVHRDKLPACYQNRKIDM